MSFVFSVTRQLIPMRASLHLRRKTWPTFSDFSNNS